MGLRFLGLWEFCATCLADRLGACRNPSARKRLVLAIAALMLALGLSAALMPVVVAVVAFLRGLLK